MSLEDKFYPEDGTLITKIDNSLVKLAGKIGDAYQHATGKDYTELVKTGYSACVVGFGVAACLGRPASLPFSLLSLLRCYNPRIRSPLEEEISLEAIGLPRKTEKVMRLFYAAFLPLWFYTDYSKSRELASQNNPSHLAFATATMIEDMSLALFTFLEYLSKANVPKPPKKTVWERVMEKLRVTVPVKKPATTYSPEQ